MKTILNRSTCVALVWAGAGLGAWLWGHGVGAAGWLLGIVSGMDFCFRLDGRRKCLWLMFVLGMIGIPTGLAYEYAVSLALPWPLVVNVIVFGLVIGWLFGIVSSGVVWLFGVRGSQNTDDISGASNSAADAPD